jgi:hypothetical protein
MFLLLLLLHSAILLWPPYQNHRSRSVTRDKYHSLLLPMPDLSLLVTLPPLQGEPPPEPEPFHVEGTDEGPAMAELVKLGLVRQRNPSAPVPHDQTGSTTAWGA